jgi:hypothetical protein
MQGLHVPCTVKHPSISCEVNAVQALLRSIIRGLKVYCPMYAAHLLIYRRKELLTSPTNTVQRVLSSIFRSTLFICCFNFNARLTMCYFSNLTKANGPLTFLAASLVSTLAIYCESPKRRVDLSLYLLPRTIETLWSIAHANGLVRSVQYGEVGLFALAMGVFMMMACSDAKFLPQSYSAFLKTLLGDN